MKTMKCQRPIMLKKANGTQYYRRCNSNNYSYCKYCAASNAYNYKELLKRGISDKYYYVSAVLTAPSFGKVHSFEKCGCGEKHTASDPILNTNLYNQYNFVKQVKWNNHFNKLLSYTLKKIKTRVPINSQVIGREWQKRGTLHAHILFRVESEEESIRLASLLKGAHNYSIHGYTWGESSHCEILGNNENGAVAAGAYAIKGLAYNNRYSISKNRENYIKNFDKAIQTIDTSKWTRNELQNLGWSGRPITFGRNWALDGSTIKSIKKERLSWVITNTPHNTQEQHNRNLEKTYKINHQPINTTIIRENRLNKLLKHYIK